MRPNTMSQHKEILPVMPVKI